MSKPFSRQGRFCSVDNDAFDVIMPHIGPAAWKVLSLVIRKTKGYGKAEDAISYSQIKGLCGKGVASRTTIANAVAELVNAHIVTAASDGPTSIMRYALNPEFDTDEFLSSPKIVLVQKMDQSRKWTSASPENGHTYIQPPSEVNTEEAPNGAVANATRSKTSRSKPQPTTPKRPKQHPDTPAVLALYRDALGYALPNGAADAKAASWMLEQGYTESQIMAAYWAMKREEFWSVRRLSLQSVKGQIGEFSRRNGTANGRNAGPSLDAMIAAEGAEWGDPSTWSDELRRQFPDAAARRATALNGSLHA